MNHLNGDGPDPTGSGNVFTTAVADMMCPDCREPMSELNAEILERDAKILELEDRKAEVKAEIAELQAEIEQQCFPLLGVERLADLKPPEWIVEGIVPEGDVVLFGQPGTYKSFLALDLALCVASGRDWHGHPVKSGNVVYAAAEGVRGMKDRIDAWQQANGPADLSRLFFVPEAVNLLDADQAVRIYNSLVVLHELPDEMPAEASDEELDEALAEAPDPALLVIDTMARSMVGGDENSAKDVGLFLAELSGLPAATRLLVHHSGKNGETERGSTALRGAADMMARVERDGQAPRIDLICHKPPKDGNGWPTMTFERELVAQSLVLNRMRIFDAKAAAAEERREAVLDFVRENGSVSQRSIEKGVGGKAVSIRIALEELEVEGAISLTREGQAKLYDIPRPSPGDAVGTLS